MRVARATFQRRAGRWLLEGGALFAMLAGAYAVYSDYRDDRASLSIEVCRRADQAISDDTLNAALTKIEQGSYMKRKLKISEQCDRQSGK